MAEQDRRAQTLAWLAGEGVPYTLVEHPAAFTMEDIAAFGVNRHGLVCKNLFLRDSKKGKRHILLTLRGDARVDLAKLYDLFGERLSFASAERLEKYLNLRQGEVTPLGVLFDEDRAVEVWFDAALQGLPDVGVHPCDNTASVFMAFDDLKALVERHGNTVGLVAVPHEDAAEGAATGGTKEEDAP